MERWFKVHSLNKVINHIKRTENENPGRIFEVRQLENTYIEILKSYGYFIESHISRSGDMLKERLPEKRVAKCRQKLTLCFKSTADALINQSVNDSNDLYQTLLETALPLQQMMVKTSSDLDDDTMNNIDQVNSIPIHLVTLVRMLIDVPGVSNRQFSQPALTIAQLIQTKFRKNRNTDITEELKNSKEKRDSCSSIFNIENLWNI